MRDNPYKDLPPLERRPDGSLYRMTPAQRKQAASLIRRECCCCENGNCIVLDDGDTCTCPQTISFSVCCKWFRWAVLPLEDVYKRQRYHRQILIDRQSRQRHIQGMMLLAAFNVLLIIMRIYLSLIHILYLQNLMFWK